MSTDNIYQQGLHQTPELTHDAPRLPCRIGQTWDAQVTVAPISGILATPPSYLFSGDSLQTPFITTVNSDENVGTSPQSLYPNSSSPA